MPVLPPTMERVYLHTNARVNENIQRMTNEKIRKYNGAGPETLKRRQKELEHEWDTERVLEANASILIFIGCALGFFVNRYWLILPGLVSLFFLQHALQGWCPPLPIIRRMGIRTAAEIMSEKSAIVSRLKSRQDNA